MKRFLKYLAVFILLMISAGCCYTSRCWKIDKEITGHVLPASGSYHYYTNGVIEIHTSTYVDSRTGKQWEGTNKSAVCVYKYCSNANGPWAGSDIYPATRCVINHLSFMSWSSAASGDYMLNIFNLPCYPIILIELPIQLVLDTVLLPWDLYSAPTTPEGYKKVF